MRAHGADTSHSTTETEKCEAFTNDQEVVIIKPPKYPMCNYYPSRMKMHGMYFPSSEHAYQWRFLKYIGQHDLAEEAIKAPSPAEAKAVAARVPKHLHKDWHLITKSIMNWFQRLPPARGGTAQRKILHLANWSQLIHPGPASSMTKFFLVSSQSCVSTLPH